MNVYERIPSLYNIFKHIEEINPKKFADLTSHEIVEEIERFVGTILNEYEQAGLIDLIEYYYSLRQ